MAFLCILTEMDWWVMVDSECTIVIFLYPFKVNSYLFLCGCVLSNGSVCSCVYSLTKLNRLVVSLFEDSISL